MGKKTIAIQPLVIEEHTAFDDVMRQLLRAKPQHKVAKKAAPKKKAVNTRSAKVQIKG